MTKPRRGVITYDGLPISSGGAHPLRTRILGNAWSEIETFLKRTTDFRHPEETTIELLEGGGTSSELIAHLKARFTDQFRFLRSRRLGHRIGHQWAAEHNCLTALIKELAALGPFPNDRLPPLTLNLNCKFSLTAPNTGRVLPFQNADDYLNQPAGFDRYLGTSVAHARLSTKSTLALFLSLPYEEEGVEFQNHLAFLRTHAPFRFSAKRWKLWRLNKRGSGYIGRRIENSQEKWADQLSGS